MSTNVLLQNKRRIKAALLIIVTCGCLTGCASPGGMLPAVNLPARPVTFGPVAVPAVKVGDSARVSLAEHRSSLLKANGTLRSFGSWYDKVRKDYSRK